jgi:ubiquitin C-terminal hydrolase
MAMLTSASPQEESRQIATSSSRQHVVLRPQNRDVARPVANLGNTCYMNAVLQALAHAPELCMAMDVEAHHVNCPIFLENAQKRRSSPSSSPDGAVADVKLSGTRKSRRSSGKKSPTNNASTSGEPGDDCKFCALCEVEQHLTRVHTITSNRDKPVAPSMFVNGFIGHVAPWFKLGQQEDSHEFLRLLIDAMQRSCKQARTSPENPQDTPPEKTGPEEEEEEEPSPMKDAEYPFQLFRGMVESNVICESCKSSSSTMDPIEDIGLDVTPIPGASSPSSPTPGYLADVSAALQRFARAEALDSGYTCEKCGKVGRATKQSRLASIPPILTLHLKRFRYGETQPAAVVAPGQSRRSNRSSEVSQLLNSGDYFGGKSGSAKIEGHSKFEQILDLKPYLTEEMQAKHSKMFCRLFAVIVHAGKNSHSGHYISYVRNIAKNEWWKMDDARITVASVSEVMNAEAYMLFYRVVEHPFALRLKGQQRQLQEEWRKEEVREEQVVVEVASASRNNTTTVSTSNTNADAAPPKEDLFERPPPANKVEDMASIANSSIMSSVRTNNSRKRKAPEYTSGEDWARAKTTLPDHVMAKFRDVENIISEYVQFKPEFFKFLTDQATRKNAKVGHGPSSGICGTYEHNC